MKYILLLVAMLTIASCSAQKTWRQSDRQPRSTMGIICRNDSLIIENPFLIKVIMVGDKAYKFNVELKEVKEPDILIIPSHQDGWPFQTGKQLIIDTTKISIQW